MSLERYALPTTTPLLTIAIVAGVIVAIMIACTVQAIRDWDTERWSHMVLLSTATTAALAFFLSTFAASTNNAEQLQEHYELESISVNRIDSYKRETRKDVNFTFYSQGSLHTTYGTLVVKDEVATLYQITPDGQEREFSVENLS